MVKKKEKKTHFTSVLNVKRVKEYARSIGVSVELEALRKVVTDYIDSLQQKKAE